MPAIKGDKVHVVVEASRGMTAKCKYDPKRGLFVLGKPLPHGLIYPYDWGFIPATKADDGDPLDALVLHDAACPVGCLIECQPLAVLEVKQKQKGEKDQRNEGRNGERDAGEDEADHARRPWPGRLPIVPSRCL